MAAISPPPAPGRAHGAAVPLLLAACAAIAMLQPSHAQQQGYGQTLQNDRGETGSGAAALGPSVGKGNSILDSVNPIDLMHRIRRSQALDDATPPSDAIDQALKDYSAQQSGKTGQSEKPGKAGQASTAPAKQSVTAP